MPHDEGTPLRLGPMIGNRLAAFRMLRVLALRRWVCGLPVPVTDDTAISLPSRSGAADFLEQVLGHGAVGLGGGWRNHAKY